MRSIQSLIADTIQEFDEVSEQEEILDPYDDEDFEANYPWELAAAIIGSLSDQGHIKVEQTEDDEDDEEDIDFFDDGADMAVSGWL